MQKITYTFLSDAFTPNTLQWHACFNEWAHLERSLLVLKSKECIGSLQMVLGFNGYGAVC